MNAANMIQYNIRKDSLDELPIIGEVNVVWKTIIEAERMLEKMLACSDEEVLESTRLLRVVWNTGESYVEHPSDLKIVLKITEKNN